MIKRLIFSIIFLSFPSISNALTIVSWNIRDFGQSRTDQEIRDIAQVIRHADIVAIQEVVAIHPGGAQAVERLKDQLNRMGANWDSSISDPTQSTSSHRSERYAFLWKTSKLTVTGGGPRLLSELTSYVEREPYLIQFRVNSKVLTILNYHACTHTADFPERSEILAISAWLTTNHHDNIVWAGDMNLEIDDAAFRPILNHGFTNLLNGQKTSLKKICKDGDYLSSAEDNILYKLTDFRFSDFEVLDFVSDGPCEAVKEKRVSYSDHLGVEVTLN